MKPEKRELAGHVCPSARCEPGALLLGVVQDDMRLAHLPQPLTIDAAFVAAATAAGSPEQRFRFADTCVEGRCKQWTGSACGVIESILDHLGPEARAETRLPRCAIRPRCRWYHQRGGAACQACVLVVTDNAACQT